MSQRRELTTRTKTEPTEKGPFVDIQISNYLEEVTAAIRRGRPRSSNSVIEPAEIVAHMLHSLHYVEQRTSTQGTGWFLTDSGIRFLNALLSQYSIDDEDDDD